jgi:hypothetical protein
MKKNKLRVKPSNFKSDLTFNEWAQKLGVSTQCDYGKKEIREYLDKRECAEFVINTGLTIKDEIEPVNFKPTFNELVSNYFEKYL